MNATARILRLLILALAMLSLGAAAAVAQNDTRGPKDNKAVAEASGAGDSVIDLAFSVRETASEVIDETNSAVAYASCEACRAVAIAFQIVIVQGSPKSVTPQNYAVAVNESCQGCSTLAIAYQFVVGRGQPLEFTEAGLQRLAEIREQFEELEEDFENLTNDEIRARTDAFAADIRDILDNELVPAGDNQGNGPPIDREETDVDRDGESTATTPVQPPPSEPPPTTAAPPPTETAPPATTTPTETTPPATPEPTTTVP